VDQRPRGHHGLFADGGFLARTATALADPFRVGGVTKVAGIEARGFALATAVALDLGAGFVPVRKAGAIHPGPKAEALFGPDRRGRETPMQIQCGAMYAGLSMLVDQLQDDTRQALDPVVAVVRTSELPPNV
jgi:adenine phosphoribosyltransferase